MGRRRMTDQPALFNPAQTLTVCPACQATRQPHETRAPACTVDRDRQAGIRVPRRPHNCINAHDPSTAPIPF